jgi:nucleoid-associated protein YgaU
MSAAAGHVATPVVHLVNTETPAEIAAVAKAEKAAAKAEAAEAAAEAKAVAAAAKAAAAAAKKAQAKAAVVVKAVTPPVTAPISTLRQTSLKNTTPNLVGTWTGTMLYDGDTVATPFSIDFQFQLEAAASGAFNLGPAIGNQTAQSTMVITNHNNVRALILNSTLWVGFTGVLEPGSNMIFGRFAYNSPTGWKSGSFTVTRN